MGLRGPKPGEYGEGRTVVVPVRLSPEEHEDYRQIAEAAGMRLGTWIRAAMELAREIKKGERTR